MEREMILVDTSSWIEALRVSGRREIRERVSFLLVNGLAAWCDMVAVELWNGASGDYEKKKLAELEKEVTCLQVTRDVWALARRLARECRSAGETVPCADLVIVSCAMFHGVGIEHEDEHIDCILQVHKQLKG